MSAFSTIIDLSCFGSLVSISSVTGQPVATNFNDDKCFTPLGDVIPHFFDNDEGNDQCECIVSYNPFTAECKRQIDGKSTSAGRKLGPVLSGDGFGVSIFGEDKEFKCIDDMLRKIWRNFFLSCKVHSLDGITPIEAAKTPEGRGKLEKFFNANYGHLQNSLRQRMRGETEAGFFQRHYLQHKLSGMPSRLLPRAWVRWKLGLDSIADGATRFAKEEAIFTGADGTHFFRHTCSSCPKLMDRALVCERCRCRRYCSRECQKKDWKEHKKHCVPAAASEEEAKEK